MFANLLYRMDQAASIFGLQGSAIYVSFTPKLSAESISFPNTEPEFCFVIAQTFVEAIKHATAPIHYNLRAVECSLAAAVLFSLTGLRSPLSKEIKPQRVTLREFQSSYFDANQNPHTPKKLSMRGQLRKLLEISKENLQKSDGYTRKDISLLLSMPVKELEERFMTAFPVEASHFKLRQRTLHVFSEALRVHRFMDLLQKASDQTDKEIGAKLGELMNQSQKSCRYDYDCSSSELDQLCQIAQEEGAYGSRLTGAGWGGCSVHLIPVNRISAVMKAWEHRYYAKLALSPQQRQDAVTMTKPGNGSVVYFC